MLYIGGRGGLNVSLDREELPWVQNLSMSRADGGTGGALCDVRVKTIAAGSHHCIFLVGSSEVMHHMVKHSETIMHSPVVVARVRWATATCYQWD